MACRYHVRDVQTQLSNTRICNLFNRTKAAANPSGRPRYFSSVLRRIEIKLIRSPCYQDLNKSTAQVGHRRVEPEALAWVSVPRITPFGRNLKLSSSKPIL
ncbi:hypothetical protein ANTPLA_LOCUS593 [Anthophora plagiata]